LLTQVPKEVQSDIARHTLIAASAKACNVLGIALSARPASATHVSTVVVAPNVARELQLCSLSQMAVVVVA
jgi:hypothetical protein